MEDPSQQIGQLISRLRQKRGLTQAELARQLGTSQSAVNRMEQGKQNFSLNTLRRIEAVLNYQLIKLNDPDALRTEVTRGPDEDQITIVLTSPDKST